MRHLHHLPQCSYGHEDLSVIDFSIIYPIYLKYMANMNQIRQTLTHQCQIGSKYINVKEHRMGNQELVVPIRISLIENRGLLLTRKLLNQWFLLVKLKSLFYGRHHDLVDCYGISVSQMTRICFTCRKHFPVLSSFTTYYRVCK